MLEKAHRHLAVAFGAAALVVACAGGENANEGGDSAAVGTSTGAVDTTGGAGGAGANAPMSDAQIFGYTNMVDQAEVEAGELARTKARNAQVKQYAQSMVTEHSNHMRQAGQLAQQVGQNPSEPANDPQAQQHEQLMNSLRQASGAQFDSLYIAGQIQEHQMTLDRLNAAQNNTQNAQLREFLSTTRQAVQQHLERAQQIQGQLRGNASGNS